MKAYLLLLCYICCIQFDGLLAQTRVIAHRGFWDTPGSAQNSIAALQKADSIGCYGSEFDVWLTKDNHLVVNHDAIFKGVNLQQASYRKCRKLTLRNGEKLPSLQDYLKQGRLVKTQLIIEIKPHHAKERELKAVELVTKMVEQYQLTNNVQYISFSKDIVKALIKHSPKGTPVFYLGGDLSPAELKNWGCAGADYHYKVFKKHPEWIEECHKLGMKVNAWTVNSKQVMNYLMELNIDYITTNDPITALILTKTKK